MFGKLVTGPAGDPCVSQRLKAGWRLSAAMLIAGGLLASGARAEPSALRIESAPLVSPTEAQAYYGSGTTRTGGLCTSAPSMCDDPPPPEYPALVRSLSRDGQLSADAFAQAVYEYVRRNVDTEYRYGLSKGGQGALFEQSGTPFDQVQLMAELLQLGGVSSTLEVGTITLDGARFQAWTGLTDATAACRLLANGGIPAVINGVSLPNCAYSGSVSSVQLGHIWLVANGKRYDPGYRAYVHHPGIPLQAALGCGGAAGEACATAALAAALPTGSTGYDSNAAANYVQNVDETALETALKTPAIALQTYIRANLPAASVEQIVGGKTVDAREAPSAASSLPYPTTVWATWTAGVPDQYRSALGVQFHTLSRQLFLDEIYYTALYVEMTGGTTNTRDWSLFIDRPYVAQQPGVELQRAAIGSVTTPGGLGQGLIGLSLSVRHPYAALSGSYMDEDITKQIEPYNFYIQQWWGTARSKVGWNAGWIPQVSRALVLNDGISGVITTQHHTVAIRQGIEGGTLIIDGHTALSISSRTADDAVTYPAAQSVAALFSAFEGSVLEQATDSSAQQGAISLFHLANEKGVRFFEATPANVETVLARTTNYGNVGGQSEKDLVRAYFQGGGPAYSAIVPQNGNTGYFSSSSMGGINIIIAPVLAYTADASRIAYMTTYRNKGAGGPLGSPDPVGAAPEASREKPFDMSLDLATGDARLTFAPDIVSGAGPFPASIAFQRRQTISPVSGGGTNNLTYVAQFSNGAYEAMGAASGIDASAMIAALFTMRELNRTPTFHRRAVNVFAAHYITRLFSGNVVTVQRGFESTSFHKMPDGTFNPDNHSSDRLVQTGFNRTPFTGPRGFLFTYSGIGFTLTDSVGSVTTFTWGECGDWNRFEQLWGKNCYAGTRIDYPDGMNVVFTYDYPDDGPPSWYTGDSYIGKRLKSVRNALGRQLNFSYGCCDNLGFFNVTNVSDLHGRTWSSTVGLAQDAQLNLIGLQSVETAVDGTTTRWMNYFTPWTPNGRWMVNRSEFMDQSDRPILTLTYDQIGRVATVADGVGAVTKYYPGKVVWTEQVVAGEKVDPLGAVSRELFGGHSKVIEATTPIGQTTRYDYDGLGRVVRTVYPEGNAEELTYDVRSNRLTTTQKPKPGSALPDVMTSQTYAEGPSIWTCANPVTCNRPIAGDGARTDIVDVSDFTWNPTTGQLLTTRLPANADGLRPQVDYGYSPLAIPGGSAVSLLVSRTEKIDASSSVTTAYEYDVLKNLTLKSSTVDPGGLGLRTCYLFDDRGNLISESPPRTATCPTVLQ